MEDNVSHHPRAVRTRAVAFAAIVAASGNLLLFAQDKVIIQKPGATSRITLPCTILNYTGTAITVRLNTGTAEMTYPASEVVEVLTAQTENHERGLKLFSELRIDEAAAAFSTALKEENRLWVRREILAMLVRCSLYHADCSAAGTQFLLLVASDPATRHFQLIPLVWAPIEAASGIQPEARAWLADNLEVARLLGASLLLDDSDYGGVAESELRKLLTSLDGRVRKLAQAQLWRKRFQSPDMGRMELERWESRIREMPSDLRGGPYYLLGKGHWLRQEYERAAAAWLWLPLVYDYDLRLAARACFQAAEALARMGQTREAATLFREVAIRFTGTGFDEEAARQIENLARKKDSPAKNGEKENG